VIREMRKRKKPKPVKKGSSALKQLNKLKPITLFMIKKYLPGCFFCHSELTEEDLFLFTLHHVDQNREHNAIGNLEASHRKCHKAFHARYTKALTALLKEVE
jgi:hypothetical protein